MKTRKKSVLTPEDTHSRAAAVDSLVRVRDQAEQVKESVEECAQELASVNTSLKGELEKGVSIAGVGRALDKAQSIEAKVQDAADELSSVNEALGVQVGEKHDLVEHVVAVKKEAILARHAAFHDPLTSLSNRAMLEDRLEHGLAQAKRHGRILGLLFIDLDKFKSVNDTFGHAAGDKVLKKIAERLKSMTRDEDTVGRIGGDEFLYLLTELRDEADALAVAGKVLHALSAECDVGTDGNVINHVVSPSIGIAVYPKDGDTAEGLLSRADEAMYRAKRGKLGFSLAR